METVQLPIPTAGSKQISKSKHSISSKNSTFPELRIFELSGVTVSLHTCSGTRVGHLRLEDHPWLVRTLRIRRLPSFQHFCYLAAASCRSGAASKLDPTFQAMQSVEDVSRRCRLGTQWQEMRVFEGYNYHGISPQAMAILMGKKTIDNCILGFSLKIQIQIWR